MPFTGIPALRKGRSGGGSGPFPPGSNPPVTFVFRPGGVAGGNVYTTWAALYAVLSTVQGPKWVEVDSSLAPAIVPAGAYDLADVELRGHIGDLSTPMVLQFADGATITNLGFVSEVLTLRSLSTSPVMTLTTVGQYALFMTQGCTIESTTAPFIDVAGAATIFTLVIYIGCNFVSAGSEFVTLSSPTAAMQLLAFNVCTVADDLIAGVAGSLLFLLNDANSALSETQTGFAGTLVHAFADDAGSVAYTLPPLNTGAPGNVRAALNQAAYVLSGAGSPNAGGGVPALIGWIYIDTLNGLRYMNQDGTPTGWWLI